MIEEGLTEEVKKEVTRIIDNEIERLGGVDKVRNLPINDVLTEIFGNLLSQISGGGLIEPKVELLRMEISKKVRK